MDEWLRALVNRAYWIGVHETDMDVGTALLAQARPGFLQHQYEEAWRLAQVGAASLAALQQLTVQETSRYLGGERQTTQGQQIALGNAPLSTFATAGSPAAGAVVVRVLLTYTTASGERDDRMVTLNADWSETPSTLVWYAQHLYEGEAAKYGSELVDVGIIGPLI